MIRFWKIRKSKPHDYQRLFPSNCTAACQTYWVSWRSNKQPTTLQHLCIHLPWEHQHCNPLLHEEGMGWPGSRGCAQREILVWPWAPRWVHSTTVGCRSNTQSWKELQNCQETARAGQQHTGAHKVHTGSPKASKIHLTKLIHICSFLLCLSDLKQVINFLVSAEHEAASFQWLSMFTECNWAKYNRKAAQPTAPGMAGSSQAERGCALPDQRLGPPRQTMGKVSHQHCHPGHNAPPVTTSYINMCSSKISPSACKGWAAETDTHTCTSTHTQHTDTGMGSRTQLRHFSLCVKI